MGSEVLEMSVGRGSKRVGENWVRSLAGLSSASLVLWSEWELTREDAAGLLVQPGFRRGGGETQKFGGLEGLVSGLARSRGVGLEVKRGLEKTLGLVVVVSVIGFGFGCWVGLDVCQGLTPNFPGWLQACQAKGAWGYYYYSLFDFQVFF